MQSGKKKAILFSALWADASDPQGRALVRVLAAPQAGPHAQIVHVLHQLVVRAVPEDRGEDLRHEAGLGAVAALLGCVHVEVDEVLARALSILLLPLLVLVIILAGVLVGPLRLVRVVVRLGAAPVARTLAPRAGWNLNPFLRF